MQQLTTINDQIKSLQAQLSQFNPQQYSASVSQTPIVQPDLSGLNRRRVHVVDGIDGAKQYQASLAPDSDDVVMDSNVNCFYLVKKDANGISPSRMTIGDFTLRTEEAPEDLYATKKDFEALRAEILQILNNRKESSDVRSFGKSLWL